MISTSELFDIGSGIKRICEENTVYLNALIEKDNEIERLREALKLMVDEKCDYMKINNLGDPEQQHTIKTARAALKEDE